MTEKKKEKHVCKFKRKRYKSGNEVFFCTLPDCNKKCDPSLLLGKLCICWKCGEVFPLNEYSLRLAKPHCEGCHKSKKDVNVEINPDGSIAYGPERYSEVPDSMNMSLQQRLNQTLQNAQTEGEDEI